MYCETICMAIQQGDIEADFLDTAFHVDFTFSFCVCVGGKKLNQIKRTNFPFTVFKNVFGKEKQILIFLKCGIKFGYVSLEWTRSRIIVIGLAIFLEL